MSLLSTLRHLAAFSDRLSLDLCPRLYLCLYVCLALVMQLSWSMMSGYCHHESGRAAHHVGHHAHEHAKMTQKIMQDVTKNISEHSHQDDLNPYAHDPLVDADCPNCHLSFYSLMPMMVVVPSLPSVSAVPPLHTPRYQGAIPAPPDRPQWLSLLS
jgi:hypothetical protein